jgi:hypothetical protein
MLRRKKYDQGIYLRVPRHRRLILDICRASCTVPTFAVDRNIPLEQVHRTRKNTRVRIGWATLFARAYGLVAAEVPQLRQTFISLPWPRLYQHPSSIVSITINRVEPQTGEERLVWSRVRNIERLTLQEIQGGIEQHQHGDISELFRERRILEAMPGPIRQVAWHLLMRWMGRKRARHLGTFSLSTLANFGTTNHAHPLIVTSSLSYGPLDDNFCSRVTLQADHRVLDGAVLARALVRLEDVMNTVIIDELQALNTSTIEIRKAS